VDEKQTYSDMTSCSAALSGQLESLKFLKSIGCDMNEGVVGCAVERRDLRILEWLKENGLTGSAKHCCWAAQEPVFALPKITINSHKFYSTCSLAHT
jgi:hypothetical protein